MHALRIYLSPSNAKVLNRGSESMVSYVCYHLTIMNESCL